MQKGDAMDAAERSERIPDIVIITGMSGSGRTQAMHVFEDMGYFCIDNLPPRLIAQLAELVGINTGVGRHLAVTCDLRSQGLFDELLDAVAALDPGVDVLQNFMFAKAFAQVLQFQQHGGVSSPLLCPLLRYFAFFHNAAAALGERQRHTA